MRRATMVGLGLAIPVVVMLLVVGRKAPPGAYGDPVRPHGRAQRAPVKEVPTEPRIVDQQAVVEVSDEARAQALVEGPGVVALIVTESTRADHLSACGYGRPTSPGLERLVAEEGLTLQCDGVSVSTGVVPSMVSLFSGRPPLAHGVVLENQVVPGDTPLLAETFQARGYQTLFVNGHPGVRQESGLWRGFDRVVAAPPALQHDLRADGTAKALREQLGEARPDAPVFVVVHLFDAHDPYPKVPQGVDWVPPQSGLALHGAMNPSRRFVTGKMPPKDRKDYQARMTDTYDHALSIQDASLVAVWEALEALPQAEHGLRVAVASTHGEHVGDHGAVRHFGAPWRSVLQVPFAFHDSEGTVELPARLQQHHVHDLLIDGELPGDPGPVVSVSLSMGGNAGHTMDAVALRDGTRKLVWFEGGVRTVDLQADPFERSPVSDVTNEDRKALEPFVLRFQAVAAEARSGAEQLATGPKPGKGRKGKQKRP